jgi:uncharacterized protein (TIGR02453 family)
MDKRAVPVFPKEGLQFLRSLKRNNNREWFQERKDLYETHVKQPMQNLLAALVGAVEKFAPEMTASPKVSRIYRDVRFSKDKSPYKSYVALGTGLKDEEGARFYLHIDTAELFIGGGMYMPSPEELRAVRGHIAEKPAGFTKIVKARRFRAMFGAVEGEQLSRVPRDVSPDHPAAEYLRHQQFYVGRTFPPEKAIASQFYALAVETFREMVPFVRFLNEPILKNRRIRNRQEALLK